MIGTVKAFRLNEAITIISGFVLIWLSINGLLRDDASYMLLIPLSVIILPASTYIIWQSSEKLPVARQSAMSNRLNAMTARERMAVVFTIAIPILILVCHLTIHDARWTKEPNDI